jgi:hypothetical protein
MRNDAAMLTITTWSAHAHFEQRNPAQEGSGKIVSRLKKDAPDVVPKCKTAYSLT